MIALVSENESFHQTSCEQEGQQRTTELFCSFVFQPGKPVILSPRQPGLSCLANEPGGGIPAGTMDQPVLQGGTMLQHTSKEQLTAWPSEAGVTFGFAIFGNSADILGEIHKSAAQMMEDRLCRQLLAVLPGEKSARCLSTLCLNAPPLCFVFVFLYFLFFASVPREGLGFAIGELKSQVKDNRIVGHRQSAPVGHVTSAPHRLFYSSVALSSQR